MSLRPILIHPDPRLRKRAAEIETVDDSVRRLADDMLETMYDAPGIGLAAPQIGLGRRIFVMDCATEDEAPAPTVCINPVVTWESEDRALSEEGCLSIPDIFADVERAARIRLAWLDRDGAPKEVELTDRWAICAQHELDHLNGRLFIDYLSPVRRSMVTQKMKKLKKDRARA